MASVAPPVTAPDAFARVSAALLAVWPRVQNAAAGLSASERGLVLDECGSDYRPLVDLLLDIGRQVRPALAPMSGAQQTASVWANTRAPQVHRLVATRYLQPDVARWAVDVWGRALGVAPPPESPVVMSATEDNATDTSPAARAGAAGSRGSGTVAIPRAAANSPPHATAWPRNAPSWAGGPVALRVGGKPSSASLIASGRLTTRSAVAPGPRYQLVERRAAVVLALLLVVITLALSQALRERRALPTMSQLPVASTPAATEGVGADSLVADPLTAGDATPSPALVPLVQPEESRDASAASSPQPPEAMATLSPTPVGTVIDAGIGGRYLVTQEVRDVSGTENCEAVASALGRGRETVEIVEHEAGAPTFVLATRQVTGTLAADGWFTAMPRSGTTNNVNWQFRMRGRFGRDGFRAVSETYTEAILRWGRTQHCVVTADLTGRRLPG